MEKLVSIVMPSFNSINHIESSINSVLNQNYGSWELLITDDSSIDESYDLLSNYSSMYNNIKVFKNNINYGAAYSRNKSISQSSGDYIAFLDSDDFWHRDKLTKQINFMEYNNFYFSHSYYTKLRRDGSTSLIKSLNRVSYNDMLYTNHIGCLTAIYNSHILGKMYMPEIRKRQDWGLWLDILKVVDYSHCIPCNLATYRFGTGMTKNKFKVLREQYSFYKNTVKLKGFKLQYYFLFYMLFGLKKYFS